MNLTAQIQLDKLLVSKCRHKIRKFSRMCNLNISGAFEFPTHRESEIILTCTTYIIGLCIVEVAK